MQLNPCPCLGERCCYLDAGGVMRAALITRVWNEQGQVSLCVFPDDAAPQNVAQIEYEEEGVTPNTWHWPERAGPAT